MVETRSGTKKGKGNQPSTGEKHQKKHESPQLKRTKQDKHTHLDQKTQKAEEFNEDLKDEDAPQTANDADKATSDVKSDKELSVPSNIMEKGIIYFFIRGRVNIEKPSSVNEIARSYILLRPVDIDTNLGEGPIGDAGNTRLLVLPKKTLPRNGRDRFMTFVEESGASLDKLKEELLSSNDYNTKTAGTRHSPASRPVGEGVYVITSTGRETHLAYMTTLPETLDVVQKKLGLKKAGSFIISTKNPEYPGPANAPLPRGPKFSKDIMEEFGSLRWLPSKPSHLDYPNAQILLIGESSGIKNAVEPQEEHDSGEQEPEAVLEHLEEEDLNRMKQLSGDQSASIFADLQARAEDYTELQTTF